LGDGLTERSPLRRWSALGSSAIMMMMMRGEQEGEEEKKNTWL
jgi:hypothetical protein